MTTSPEALFNIVKENLEKHEYRGIDPYDFFESKRVPNFFFNEQIGSKFTFLNKISPVNFRQFLAIGRNYNSKAMALILSAYLNCTHNFDDEVPFIVDWLINNKSHDFDEYSLGFTFNIALSSYVSRAGEPSLIITLFAMYAFMEYHRRTKDDKILQLVLSFERLLDTRLPKFESEKALWYSYTFTKPTEVYNATAKVGKFYSLLYKITNDGKYIERIRKILGYLRTKQRDDGTWPYSVNNPYTDGFHTAFVLDAVWHMLENVNEERYSSMYKYGVVNYKEFMFTDEYRPLHFHLLYRPKDIRQNLLETEIRDCATAISFFSQIGEKDFAEKILRWTTKNMFDHAKGHFYFYKNKFWTSKIDFVRWQAWMFYALSTYLKEPNGKQDH